MDKIVSLCKRRGFVFPGSEIYGGLAGTYDYGPLGVLLKNNVKDSWMKKFVYSRTDMYALDAAILMNEKVWQASGHVEGFADPMVECTKCKRRFRADQIEDKEKCEECGGALGDAKQFNMMFKTAIGASEESANVSYLRPETAQGIFVNFKNVVDTLSPKLPFGIGQIGKAFRNEITPRDFLFRLREFEQMEIEYFVKPDDGMKYFEYWKNEMMEWMGAIGLNMKSVHEVEIPDGERAHYSSRTVDFEFVYPFGQKELYGLAYRTDYDLKKHAEKSKTKLQYTDQETAETFVPHVIEPTFGVDRTVLALLLSAYREDVVGEEARVYLDLKPSMAPYKVAISPLLKNKPELVAKAQVIFAQLKLEFGNVLWDDNGNIGKRYRRQDEIGTPFCITVDFDTLSDDKVTVRDRNTTLQERIGVTNLVTYFKQKMEQ